MPLTKDGKIFAEAVKLGRQLIWLHTYAERFRGSGRGEEVPKGKATTIKGVSSDPAQYPVKYSYDATKREISVGDGRFGPVAPKVWEFEVSGLKVVQSWLGYRMKKRLLAKKYISEGDGEYQRIMGDKERDVKIVSSEAYRQAETIKGEADAKATQIYAESYGKDQDFYQFWKTLNLYQEGLVGNQTRLILGTDNPLFELIKGQPLK